MVVRVETKKSNRVLLLTDVAFDYLIGKYGENAVSSIEFDGLEGSAFIVDRNGSRLRLCTVIAKQFVPSPQKFFDPVPANGDEGDLRIPNIKWISKSERQRGKAMRRKEGDGIYRWGSHWRIVLNLEGRQISEKFEAKEEANGVAFLLKSEFKWSLVDG